MVRHVTDTERRARLGVRHALAAGHRVTTAEEAARTVVVLHSSEPPTVHLSVRARTEGVQVADVDRCLYEERSLVKQLAMRRTLFVFPRDLLPAAWGSASARVAAQQRAQLAKETERAGLADDGQVWLDAARVAVMDRLADGSELSAQALREELAALSGHIEMAAGKAYGGSFPIAPRVLGLLGAEGHIVRGRNAGHWRISRPLWTSMSAWLGEAPARLSEAEGYAELLRRYLARFGPATEADMVWWLGSTKTAVRRALADLAAAPVTLDGGDTGWLLPDDLDEVTQSGDWAALLPVLDPTTMGWRGRSFYLDPAHTPYLFDSNGNGGTTAWWNGRIVGCWVLDDAGVVHVVPRDDLTAVVRRALAREASRLTEWLGGVRVTSVFASLQMRSAVLP